MNWIILSAFTLLIVTAAGQPVVEDGEQITVAEEDLGTSEVFLHHFIVKKIEKKVDKLLKKCYKLGGCYDHHEYYGPTYGGGYGGYSSGGAYGGGYY